jgi:pimeloyl-ACP methyl ester carboxylesterase
MSTTPRLDQLQAYRQSHTTHRCTLLGREWSYQAAGQGDQTLMLLGGALSVGESAFRLIQRFEPDFRVLSPTYPPVDSMAALTDGLAALLEAVGAGRTHVFGHSLGAAIAHVLARRHPECIERLALSGFGLYSTSKARRVRFLVRFLGLLPYPHVCGFLRGRIARGLAPLPADERADALAFLDHMLQEELDKELVLSQYGLIADLIENAAAYQLDEQIHSAGRVLIVSAADDRSFSAEERERLLSCYPGARVHLFRHGGHMLGSTRRQAYQALLSEFLGCDPDAALR